MQGNTARAHIFKVELPSVRLKAMIKNIRDIRPFVVFALKNFSSFVTIIRIFARYFTDTLQSAGAFLDNLSKYGKILPLR